MTTRREDAAGAEQQAVAMLLQQVLVWREQAAAASRVAADSGSPSLGKWDPAGKAGHLANLANALDFVLAQFRDATAALSTAERDAKRWRWFRQFLSVEDDAGEGGQYLFMADDRIPEATFLPGFEHTVEELVDLRARVPSGGEEGR